MNSLDALGLLYAAIQPAYAAYTVEEETPSNVYRCDRIAADAIASKRVENELEASLDRFADGQFAELSKGRLWFRDTGGNGEPVLLLHPESGTQTVWLHQIEAFQSAGYRVILLDRRGAGHSEEGPAGHRESSDVLELLDHLGIDRAHLVGAAGGGLVALRFAVKHMDRVETLTISNSLAGTPPQVLGQLLDGYFPPSDIDICIRELGPRYRFANPAGAAIWAVTARNSIMARSASLTQAERASRRRTVIAGMTTSQDLARFETPTLLLTGGADQYAPFELVASTAKSMANAQVRNIPDAGHAIHWEQPLTFNSAVISFLQESDCSAQ